MKYESIADIYSAHDKIRERFLAVAGGISDEESQVLPDGEKWSIKQIVEHIAIVETNMQRICFTLTEAARVEGKPSKARFSLSPEFGTKINAVGTMKLEAPERVHPSGELTLSESLERLSASTGELNGLREAIEAFDGTDHRFPHPFFGDLTAAEWLVVRGGHEHRHTIQIERLLERIRN